ncbi:MAG: hypothetical protein IPL62_07140 [Caulobacteraceae bacterium]|nr:hypothetical protein [Caulobacteraceae bacterium]
MFDPKMRRLRDSAQFFCVAPPALAQTPTAPDIVVTGVRPDQAQSFVHQAALDSRADSRPIAALGQ